MSRDRAVARALLRLGELPTAGHVPAVTAAQMAEIDSIAADEFAVTALALMENASYQAAAAARRFLHDLAEARIVVLAGKGNNGGDGLGAARRLHGWGARVACVLAAERGELSALARRQLDTLQRIGVPIVAELPPRAELVLDGLLGYSVQGAPRGPTEQLVRAANASGIPIIAIDLPSGLDPNTGEPQGETIRADWTVTLAIPKSGVLVPRAHGHVGELLVADIGIPPEAGDRFGIDTRRVFADGDLVRVLVP